MRIELKGVKKRFGETEVLRGIELQLQSGTRAALVGPNGSGKSTLIRALLGLISCEGEVLLDGRSPFEDRLVTARRLAYVPQVAPQLSATVDELVATVTTTRGLPRADVAEAARELDLELKSIGARPFRLLSGGMKQKLLIALALAARPALYVLDEPTASLDAGARDRFFRLFAARAGDATVLLCSHRLDELRELTTHVVSLDEGRVAFDGPVAEHLKLRPPAARGVEGERLVFGEGVPAHG